MPPPRPFWTAKTIATHLHVTPKTVYAYWRDFRVAHPTFPLRGMLCDGDARDLLAYIGRRRLAGRGRPRKMVKKTSAGALQ